MNSRVTKIVGIETVHRFTVIEIIALNALDRSFFVPPGFDLSPEFFHFILRSLFEIQNYVTLAETNFGFGTKRYVIRLFLFVFFVTGGVGSFRRRIVMLRLLQKLFRVIFVNIPLVVFASGLFNVT